MLPESAVSLRDGLLTFVLIGDPSIYVFTVYAAPAFKSCPASAGAAETANGAVERMVLLGLTSRIIPNFAAMRSRRGRNQLPRKPPRLPTTLTHAQRQAYTVKKIQRCPTHLTYSSHSRSSSRTPSSLITYLTLQPYVCLPGIFSPLKSLSGPTVQTTPRA